MNANSDRLGRRNAPSPIGPSLILWATFAAMLSAAGLQFLLGAGALSDVDMPDIASAGAQPDRHSMNDAPLASNVRAAPASQVQNGHAIPTRKHLRPWEHPDESSAQRVGQPREGTANSPDDAETVRRSIANYDE